MDDKIKELKKIIDPEKDSLRFYMLGNSYQTKIEHFGVKNDIYPRGNPDPLSANLK